MSRSEPFARSRGGLGWALPALTVLASACSQTDVYSTSGAGTGRHSTGTTTCGAQCGTVNGGSSSGSGSGSTGTTGGAQVQCSQLIATPDAGCPSGQVQISGAVYDLCATLEAPNSAHVPLAGVEVAAFGCSASATTTDDTGAFSVCVPPGLDVTTVYSDSSYVTSNMAEVAPTQNLSYVGAKGGIFLFCSTAEELFAASLSAWDTTSGAVIATVASLSEQGICHVDGDAGPGSFEDYSGWVYQATYLDGDAGPWPLVYLNAKGQPDPSATSTSATGFALIYNIDAGEIGVTVQRAPPDSSDLATQCPIQNSSFGFTGHVMVVPSQIGYSPFLVP